MMSIRTALSVLLPALSAIETFAQQGPLDPHFGIDGVAITATAPGSDADFQNGIAIQRDGRILVGGESDMGAKGGGFQWRINRYTRNGAPDPTFGSGGTVLTSMSEVGGFDERLIALAVQRDGRILAAGFEENPPGAQSSVLARYNPDGTLDASFGTGGKVVTDVAQEPDHDFINQVAVDSEGRIVVAGGCRRRMAVKAKQESLGAAT